MNRASAIPVSAIELAPQTLAEELEAVGLTKGALIREVNDEAEAMGEQPLDLLADRLEIPRAALWNAAEQSGMLLRLTKVYAPEDEGSRWLQEHSENPANTPEDTMAMQMLAAVTDVEWEAIELLHRLMGEEAPLVTRAEFRQGAGIDPQLSPRIQSWQSHIETSVCRRGIYPEDPEELGYGEVPVTELSRGSAFAPQCVVGYDGPQEIGFENDDQLRPWFWTNPTAIVHWPSERELTDLDTVAEIVGWDQLADLKREVSDALRQGLGILGYKVISRSRRNQFRRVEEQVAGIYKLRKLANSGDPQARAELKRQSEEILGKSAGWTLHQAVVEDQLATVEVQNGQPVVDEKGDPVFRLRPELTRSARMIHQLRRRAQRKVLTKTAIVWVDPAVLNEGLRQTIGLVLPEKDWALLVWINPHECGITDIEAAAGASGR